MRKTLEEAGVRGYLTFEACQRQSEENAQLGLKEDYDFCKDNNKDNSLVQGLMSIHTLFTGDEGFVMQSKKMADEIWCRYSHAYV
ncbi:hypothetical protein AZF37_06460 [endosymbiont 'TC1' of Trimyema compressum]|uniref:hypothetical protein n=1 Tax=endosymbiont 'TC1' of Trimyema compressum TaxID=243899 RepID=UPI0007F0F99C|nr:hypothetical protein [endosymbiont 'TC1' of Trimyema compressum]AMP20858.1 hypothetical protein AZF37_06460 [endosymbiont 'TC1' of Trimyema compressum]